MYFSRYEDVTRFLDDILKKEGFRPQHEDMFFHLSTIQDRHHLQTNVTRVQWSYISDVGFHPGLTVDFGPIWEVSYYIPPTDDRCNNMTVDEVSRVLNRLDVIRTSLDVLDDMVRKVYQALVQYSGNDPPGLEKEKRENLEALALEVIQKNQRIEYVDIYMALELPPNWEGVLFNALARLMAQHKITQIKTFPETFYLPA